MESMDLSGDVRQMPVNIRTDGNTVQYILREMDGAASVEYSNATMERTSAKVNEDGKVTFGAITGMADLEALLVHLCLYREGARVPLDEVKKFSARNLRQLYKAAMALNDMEMSKQEVKNG